MSMSVEDYGGILWLKTKCMGIRLTKALVVVYLHCQMKLLEEPLSTSVKPHLERLNWSEQTFPVHGSHCSMVWGPHFHKKIDWRGCLLVNELTAPALEQIFIFRTHISAGRTRQYAYIPALKSKNAIPETKRPTKLMPVILFYLRLYYNISFIPSLLTYLYTLPCSISDSWHF